MSKTKFPRRLCRACFSEVSKHEKVYCNNLCQKNYERQQRKSAIELAGVFPSTVNGKVAKRYLLEKYGHCCSICKFTKWQQVPIPLVLDHID